MAFERALMRRLWFVCIAALLTIVSTALTKSSECQSGSLRLPKRIKPIHYDLKMSLDWKKFQFRGRVVIDVEFDHSATERDLVCKLGRSPPPSCDRKKIILHAGQELEIETVEFVRARRNFWGKPMRGNSSKKAVNFCRDSSNNQLILELDRALDSTGQIFLTYTGQLKKDVSKGFLLSEEHDSQGEYTPLWVTTLEPGWARTVFPCFDEPDLKATFGVTIEHPKGLTALSNMHEIKRVESDDHTEVQFERTPKMSTYLFAIAIGKLDHIETTSPSSKITFRAWAPPGRAEEARESLNIIVESYEKFANYFNVKQPLDKIDYISVSRSNGGMESWGLVTVRPMVLLNGKEIQEDSVSLNSVYYAKVTIVHEIAHFWFGDLVTMKWWDDLWLNEGFAVFAASDLTNEMFPKLGGKNYDLIHEQANILEMMTKAKYAHPIKQLQLQSMDEIQDSFDVITYNKASAVIRMLSNFLGEKKFQIGLQNYIKKFMYKNAEAEDLWNSMNEVSDGLDVGTLMNSWIYQEGFPLVEASLDRSDNSLRLRQRKFPRSPYKSDQREDILWVIPISFMVSDSQNQSITTQTLLELKEAKFELPDWFKVGQAGHFVKVNLEFSGLFRVIYDEVMLKALKEPIANKILSPADRMNLLDDYHAFKKIRLIPKELLDNLSSWYKGEQQEIVVMSLVSIADTLSAGKRYKNHAALNVLKEYFHNEIESAPDVPEAGLLRGQEDLLRAMAKARVVFSLVRFEYGPAWNFSLQYFRSRQGKVPHYMMKPIYSGVALAGTDEEFKRVKHLIGELNGEGKKFIVSFVQWALDANFDRALDFMSYFNNQ